MSRVVRRLAAIALTLGFAHPAMAQTTVRYVHTDALGSVVAMTDENRVVVERREYEPYGQQLTSIQDGPGYAGHVQDAYSGLTYMQQRYYDPDIGRFLSVDPVVADVSAGRNFNRYFYANGNPYAFTDPDGRVAVCALPPVAPICWATVVEAGKWVGGGLLVIWAATEIAEAEPSPENNGEQEQKSPEEVVDDLVSDLTRDKPPVPGKAGENGEKLGNAEDADAEWDEISNTPGAEKKDDNNVRLPDGSNANRHDSTRPYPDGPPAGTDTIKIMRPGSRIPITIRYPKG